MISFAVAVGLWLSAKPLPEPAFDRALCDARPSLPAGKANASTIEGLLRLDEPRIQECLLAAQYDGADAIDLTVRVHGSAHTRFELVGELGDRARACVDRELQALLPAAAIAGTGKVEVHFRRPTFSVVGAHAKECADPAQAALPQCRNEESALAMAQHLRRLAPNFCECFSKLASTPAQVQVELEMRGRNRTASVKGGDDEASACLAHQFESLRFEGADIGEYKLPLVFSVIDSRASAVAVAEQSPDALKRAQTTAIVGRLQSDVLLAAGRRQAAFERLNSGVQHYDQHREQASLRNAAVDARVKQNSAALGPIHTDCLELTKADTELLSSVETSLTWLRKGLELTQSAGAKPDAWQREIARETTYRATVEQERTKHSAECDEIDRASRDGFAITWHQAAPVAKPSAEALNQEASKDEGEQ